MRPAAKTLGNVDHAISAGDEAVIALISRTEAADRLGYARAFGVRSIISWWNGLQDGIARPQPLRPPLADFPQPHLPTSVAAAADRFGHVMAGITPEMAAYAIGRAYTEALPPDYRAKLGIYYTPPLLTTLLI